MAYEIERKFLVDFSHPEFRDLINSIKPKYISQGYLVNSKDSPVVRVRIMDEQGFLTIKTKNDGIKRMEFEYEIPIKDAQEMMLLCEKSLHKKRYVIECENGLAFEVDYLTQIDIWLAEIELPDENTQFKHPAWLLDDVSNESKFYNNNLINLV